MKKSFIYETYGVDFSGISVPKEKVSAFICNHLMMNSYVMKKKYESYEQAITSLIAATMTKETDFVFVAVGDGKDTALLAPGIDELEAKLLIHSYCSELGIPLQGRTGYWKIIQDF